MIDSSHNYPPGMLPGEEGRERQRDNAKNEDDLWWAWWWDRKCRYEEENERENNR